MAPLIRKAEDVLGSPLYACHFDPEDSTRLVVGGGGGSGMNGVVNRITLLSTADPTKLEQLGEIELPKTEDNPTSLAVGQKRGKTTMIYAGVNSNPSGKGKENAHFRILGVETAGTKKRTGTEMGAATSSAKITEVSRTSLFTGEDKDIYQRTTRLSNPFPGLPQLGAVTNGLDEGTELVLFYTGAEASPISRKTFTSDKEIEDVDILQVGKESYMVAYCNRHDVYIKGVSSKVDNNEAASLIYETPFAKDPEQPTVPKFRSLKWLTKNYLLMLTNIHSTGGVVLQVLRLPREKESEMGAKIVESHRMSSNIKKATGVAIANLTPPTSATFEQGYTQFIIAVAGQDASIHILKLDFSTYGDISLVSRIKPVRRFKKVHPMAVTDLSFSHFTPPKKVLAGTPPQHLKLASVSVQQTVVVHTFPLFPVPLSKGTGQSETPRYVIALPSRTAAWAGSTFVFACIAVLLAVWAQGMLVIFESDMRLFDTHKIERLLPNSWANIIMSPSLPTVRDVTIPLEAAQKAVASSASSAASLLPDILTDLKGKNEDAVVIIEETKHNDDKVRFAVHDEEMHGEKSAKSWVELSPEQKAAWSQRLSEAGHWVGDLPETMLKGVVFGELRGVIGQAVSGAI
ncbi:hypothetical protein BJ878DRAFT_454970 [Calycina marina]|uniref:Guanine nucleotide-exchange factor SEC12 n=1 Tax=Calycina marina TaxID=1763456 RepID=A0A9P8CHP4_9HELO|nr:hypothetical protein BJ878DRAFT_454970 [Calycina marina]